MCPLDFDPNGLHTEGHLTLKTLTRPSTDVYTLHEAATPVYKALITK